LEKPAECARPYSSHGLNETMGIFSWNLEGIFMEYAWNIPWNIHCA
jgi:hypothetical protein